MSGVQVSHFWMSIASVLAGCGSPQPHGRSQPTATLGQVAGDAAATRCLDVPQPQMPESVRAQVSSAHVVTWCNSAPERVWCGRISPDGEITEVPPEPAPVAPPAPSTPSAPVLEFAAGLLELSVSPPEADLRATSKHGLEVCPRGRDCRPFPLPPRKGLSYSVTATGSLVAVLRDNVKLEIYDLAHGGMPMRIPVKWQDPTLNHAAQLLGATVLACEMPAGPAASCDLYEARTGKHLGALENARHTGFSIWGGSVFQLDAERWAMASPFEDAMLVENVTTGRAEWEITKHDWIDDERGPMVSYDLASVPGGGFVLVSSYGDLAWLDGGGRLLRRVRGAQPCP